MPGGLFSTHQRISIRPLLVLVVILLFASLVVSKLTPPTIPATMLLAAAINYSEIDYECLPEYDYNCKYPARDSKGVPCGEAMPVESAQVRGVCMSANIAHAQEWKNFGGEWEAVPAAGSEPPSASSLPNPWDAHPSYSEGQPTNSFNNYPNGIKLEQDTDLDSALFQQSFKADPNAVYNETTGQYSLGPAEPASAKIQELAQPPSEANIFNGTPGNPLQGPIPPEYQPAPGQAFSVSANGTLSQPGVPDVTNVPQSSANLPGGQFSPSQTTFSGQSDSQGTFSNTSLQGSQDFQAAPAAASTNFFSNVEHSVSNFFSSWLAKL